MSNRKKQKANIFGSLLVGFLLVLAIYLYFLNTKAKASWFDDAWRYRVAIPISAHTSLETNVYITLSGADGINTTDTTKFQADCGDIRFVNEAGDQLLYYLTTACGLAQTGFQIYLESFPAGAQTIYYYYGNPSAPNGFSGTSIGVAATGVTLGTRGSEAETPSSPVLYFRFDEGTGQTISNSMETVNNGTLGPDATVTGTDPTWRTEVFCVTGKCLEFETTSSQYVNVANTIASVNSVSFWVKPTSTTTSLMVLNGAAGNASISVSSGTISAGAGFNSPTIYVNGKVSSVLVANEWQYVTVTTATGISASNIMIGRVNAGYLDGFVDEIKLFGSVLPVSQIKSGYASGLAKSSSIKNSAVSMGLGGESVPIAIGNWKFDEGFGTTANDSTSNRNDLILSTAGWVNSGKFGKAYDGASNRRLTRDDDADFDFANGSDDFSIGLWFNRGGATANQEYLLDKHSTNDGYAIYMDSDGDIACGIGDGTSLFEDIASTTNANYDDTNWHHVACVKVGTTGLYLYVDGNLVGSDTSIVADGDMSNSGKLIIGDTNETDGTDEWLGDIDEIKIYRVALTVDEIKTEFSGGKATSLGALGMSSANVANMSDLDSYCPPGQGTTCVSPVGHWRLDENSASDANDVSGNSNTLALTNTPSWVSGKFGSGVKFSGSNQHLIRADDADFDFADDASMTLETWFKHDVASAQEVILSKYNEAGYKIIMESDGDITCAMDYDSTWTPTDSITSTVATYDDGNWHHIACVKSAATSLSLYIDGVLIGADSAITATNTLTNSDPLYFGIDADGVTNDFTGALDNIMLYTVARTQPQVSWDYNKGAPISHFKFDECQGPTLYDSISPLNSVAVTIGATGTQTAVGTCAVNATTARYTGRSGKINASFNFDGTDDYAVRTGSALPTVDFSLTAWVYRNVTSNAHTILKVSPGNGTNELKLAITADDDGANNNKLRFTVDGTSAYSQKTISSAATWYHVVAVRSGAVTSMYINGVLDPVTGNDGTALSFGSCNMYIGSSPGSGCDATLTEYFDGKIDDLRIYNYALNETQIKNIMGEYAVKVGPVTGEPN